MHESESIILSYSSPATPAKRRWFPVEIVSSLILAAEVLVFVGAAVGAVTSSGYGEYSSNALVFLAVWICLGCELIATFLASLGAKRRGQVTLLLGIHGLLMAILGIMALPTLF